MTAFEFWILVGSTAMAAIIKGGAGVGAGLFLLPALSLIFDPFSALALTVPLLLVMDTFTVICHWKRWTDSKTLGILVAIATVGVVAGVIAVPYLPVRGLKLLIGIVGIMYSLSNLFQVSCINFLTSRLPASFLEGKHPAYVGAFLGGLFNAINAGGVFHAFSAMHLRLESRAFVSTTSVIILCNSLAKTIGFSINGVLPWEFIFLAVKLIPVIAIFTWLGSRITTKLSPAMFRKTIFLLIFIMCAKTLWSLI